MIVVGLLKKKKQKNININNLKMDGKMTKFNVTWEERHSAIVEAETLEEAQELANELDSDATSYECCIDQNIIEIK